ncbi:MAG: 5-oxoprolinase, partial [Phototrophicales bacterium]
SDGGIVSADQARRRAILLALSGPAAGVIGAQHEARLAGFDHIITLDIGGTSTDVALCPGELILRPESQIDGLPLRTRMLDIETIGAGGGSLAWIDSGGALRVGPASAGADPGPIVYGRGGTQITVSDANALLGRLDADHFLGGAMKLDLAASQSAFKAFADHLHLTPEQAALGVIEVANANIERALRRVSVARGYDPRGFTLVAFGGAGGLHACEVAARLSIPRVLIPRYPGVMCALGLLAADIRREYSQAIMRPLDEACLRAVGDAFEMLTTQAVDELTPQQERETAITLEYSLDARYRGQAYELNIPYTTDTLPETAFHQAHERAYGYRLEDRPIEIVSVRVGAIIRTSQPSVIPEHEHPNNGANALIGTKPIRFIDGIHPARLYDRDQLMPGARIDGAALCFQLDSTTLIPPEWKAHVDGFRNLIIEPA